MLIFVKAHYLPRILSGQKTATIRAWRSCRMQAGAPLVFNGRVHARLTRIVVGRLSTLTREDLAASGFTSRPAFLRAWREHYPTAARDAPCVVLYFVVDPAPAIREGRDS